MTVKEFLSAYCGKANAISLWDYTTEEETWFDFDNFNPDDDSYSDWKNAEVKDWEFIGKDININVIREV